MKNSKIQIVAFIVALALTLTGCSSVNKAENNPYPTLPPYSCQFDAPNGDAGMVYQSPVILYLPSRDGTRLLAVTENVLMNHLESRPHAIVEALLSYPGDENVLGLGGSVALSLTGSHPVEVSGGVCTVNLSASAMQLEHEDFYKLCLSISTTLCELSEIHYVNVLVGGSSVPLDVAGNLPMGSISNHPGEDLQVLWEQMDAKKSPLGDNPALSPLSSTVTLYFPVDGETGIYPETRNISFTGQTASQLTLGLLSVLSQGAQYSSGLSNMPDIFSLMTLNPEITSSKDGGKLISLYFVSDTENILSSQGIDSTAFFSALVMTLTTFVPSVNGVQLYFGNVNVKTLYTSSGESLSFDDGILRRDSLSPLLKDQFTFYLTGKNKLLPTVRFISYDDTENLRIIIRMVMSNPSSNEISAGVNDVYEGTFTNSDIIGLSISGDTVLVNLSARCGDNISVMTPANEQLLCFSLVNTICSCSGFNRVCFFFESKTMDTLAGNICWTGEFQPALGIVEQSIG